jgi:DNA polymerase III alpha subunit
MNSKEYLINKFILNNIMKTKFNYQAEDKTLLFELALTGLKNKIDTIPQFEQRYDDRPAHDDEYKLLKYEGYIRREISVLEDIKFDGYMLVLNDMVNTAREMGIFVSCFGSVQNSLTAYVLNITEHYEFRKWGDFINFTPFEQVPTINIVASSHRIGSIIGYMNAKYSDLIRNYTYSTSIEFNDNLILKFIDLGVDTKVRLYKEDVENLGLDIVEPDLNISNEQTGISKQNQLWLGLEALKIGDSLINRIIDERGIGREDMSLFKSFDDLLERVPMLKNLGEDDLEKLSKNRAFIKK